ncbi:MAG: FAD-binding oxidoreductase [Gemmatimonadetes bacterium]|nr:FAD-binding oxidoreductase [Gemmatimonadota bacterium]
MNHPTGFRGTFRTDQLAREAYSESAGILRVVPLAVAVPVDVEDLQRLCAWASREGQPLIPRGSGSSMAGAAVGPGVIVDLHRLRTAPSIEPSWQRAHAGTAITRAQLDAAARAHGLRFPVDPSSGAFCTLGGMVACNAAGARTLAFGATRSWVHAVECVFADGTSARVARGQVARPSDPAPLQRWWSEAQALRAAAARLPAPAVRKQSSGYGLHDFARSGDLVDLLVGSEGTLAFFTSLELDLAPLPGATATLLGAWPTIEGAVHAAALAREAGAVACELLDATFLRVAARGRTLPVDAATESVLLVELEGASAGDVTARGEALQDAWRRTGASSVQLGVDPESEEALWALRHAASPILARLDPHVRSMQVVEDGCVPPERLGDYQRGVRAALAAAHLDGVIFGHAGDAHLHVNALVDVRTAGWREAVQALFRSVAELTLRLGGTMAGEHGDGRLRTPVLADFWSDDALALFRGLKTLFDPAGVLNPGVKVVAAVDAWATIKYDPQLPALAPRVRALLDRVELERRWEESRLELLDATG